MSGVQQPERRRGPYEWGYSSQRGDGGPYEWGYSSQRGDGGPYEWGYSSQRGDGGPYEWGTAREETGVHMNQYKRLFNGWLSLLVRRCASFPNNAPPGWPIGASYVIENVTRGVCLGLQGWSIKYPATARV
ncbi:hypothetical protein JZ751_018673 [Albula glossodonta]|uniref:Uncharacterized protein n=1 Tax=Albula glossodonta TaxID=121402 RepID=A0A8T2MV90_9TELE|nr:hypothetical protein JZ751_018673 [Albula glossodonta]